MYAVLGSPPMLPDAVDCQVQIVIWATDAQRDNLLPTSLSYSNEAGPELTGCEKAAKAPGATVTGSALGSAIIGETGL